MAPSRPRRAPPEFDLEGLRNEPGLLGELERLVARWSVAPPLEKTFVWPGTIDAPPELRAFYAIAHHWPAARLYGSHDFLRPLDNLTRDACRLTFITESRGNFRIAVELVQDAWMLCACTFGHPRPWIPMDGLRLPELLVTYGLKELMFGARYLTAHGGAIEDCDVGGGFVPLWRGTYASDMEWTFWWHPDGAVAGRLGNEPWYWCGQTRRGRLWEYMGEPAPNLAALPAERSDVDA